MFKYVLVLSSILTAGGIIAGCGSKIDDLESARQSSNVAYTDANGVVTATIDASATTNQVLVASPSSKVADAAIIIPPGALSVSTAITLGEATDHSAAILTELGVTSVGATGTAVYAGPSGTTPPNTAVPLTVKLPLPLGDLNGPTGLNVADTESKLVLLYVVYADGWKSGAMPLTGANLKGAFLNASVLGFGYFQIVNLLNAVSEKKADSTIVPALNGVTPVETTTGTPVAKAITCTGDASGNLANHAYVKGCRVYQAKSSDGNVNCPYKAGALIKVGVNGDGAISMLDNSDVFTQGVLTAAPTAQADVVTAIWALPLASDTNRSVVTLQIDEVGSNDPIVTNGMKLEVYESGQVTKTCFLDYDSRL